MLIRRSTICCARALRLSTHHHPIPMAVPSPLSTHLKPFSSFCHLFPCDHGFKIFPHFLSSSCFASPLSSLSSPKPNRRSKSPVAAALLEIGGVKIAKDGIFPHFSDQESQPILLEFHLRSQLLFWLMGQTCLNVPQCAGAVEMRWVDTYFPFTNPSFELEIYFQFSEGKLGVKFKPFSKFPPCYKDISFWISDSFTENNLCEVVRGVAGDLVEEV
ncbi:hypothetical protein BHM03_00060679 [Ensete ventricosum]|nr:hypothetical protein BHM03_00060679 [Ensete ventricosum]